MKSNSVLKSIFIFLLIIIMGIPTFLLAEKPEEEGELAQVRIGIAPYTMMQIWHISKEYEIDKEFGLDFELVPISATLPGVQLLVRGDLDISSNCIAEHIAAIQGAPEIKAYSSLGFFKGFIYVGRKGEIKSIDELIEEVGLEKAVEMRRKEFKGKSFCIIPQRKPLIADTIQQVGLDIDDVTLRNFADDQKAAMAFMRGEGDFYMGSLPQERRLLQEPDEYVNAGGSEVLGPGGLWYDTMVTTDEFIINNRETALRTLAALYRTIKLWDEKREEVAQIGADAISKSTGGTFGVEEYITMQTVYDDFLSPDEIKEGMFNPDSTLYWRPSSEYYAKMALEQGDLKSQIDIDEYFPWESLFWELMDRRDLMRKVNAPF